MSQPSTSRSDEPPSTNDSTDGSSRRSFLGATASLLGVVGTTSGLVTVGSSRAQADLLRYGIVSTRGHMEVVENNNGGNGNGNGGNGNGNGGNRLPYAIEYTDLAGNPDQCDADGCQAPEEPTGAAQRNRYYSYDAEGDVPGVTVDPAPDEFVIATHGYRVTDEDFTRRSEGGFLFDLENTLDEVGYEYPYMGFSWDADFTAQNDEPIGGIQNSFHFFTEDWIGALNGLKLAKFVNWIRRVSPETDIRLLGHSLGGRVALHTLNSLYRFGAEDSIRSVTLVGPAVPKESINEDYEQFVRRATRERDSNLPPYNIIEKRGPYKHDYFNAIETVVSESTTNYFSENDPILSSVYGLNIKTSRYYSIPFFEIGSKSLGTAGATDDGNQPSNYEEEDVTEFVDQHGEYIRTEEVIRRVVERWQSE